MTEPLFPMFFNTKFLLTLLANIFIFIYCFRKNFTNNYSTARASLISN